MAINMSWGQGLSPTAFPKDFDDSPRGLKSMRIMFYNCENLFDPADDSLKFDESFTPEGNNHWSNSKYWTKQKHLAKVISALGGWEIPAIVGLCEVENKHVLINLAYNTSLKKYKYGIIHHESPDRRGIDVAMLYQKKKFTVIKDTAYHVFFPFDTAGRTRDILYVKGIALNTDTLHIFVTHWPSKYGGAFVTIPKRKYVARQIKSYSDAILKENPNAHIIIMGDFNDTPIDESVTQGLKAKSPEHYKKGDLVNLMYPLNNGIRGTHFYAGPTGNEWSVLDQMVVSTALLDSTSTLFVKNSRAHIFSAGFLLEQNDKGIIVTNRTFIGMKYHGGFSDHLPVYLDIEKKE
jgi:endonuclease/exonuclease/phosphatase family metal-dependent hydrolase